MPPKRTGKRRATGGEDQSSKIRKITEFFPVVTKTPDPGHQTTTANDDAGEPSIVVKTTDVTMSETDDAVQGAATNVETPETPSSPGSNHSGGSGSSVPSAGTDLTAESNADEAADTIYSPAPDQPLVWSEVRQPLCAALPQFKCYQGGTYTGPDGVMGMLLDAESRARDILGAQTIITTISGGRVANEHGQMTHLKDQEATRFVKSLYKNLEDKKPILVVAGSSHPYWSQRYPSGNQVPGSFRYLANLSLVDAPHRYMVLDWFHVVAITQEKDRVNTNDPLTRRWIVRLEKTDLDSPSWWYPHDRDGKDGTGYALPGQVQAKQACCAHCGKMSKQIFKQVWTCLNRECSSFFVFPDGVNTDLLQYDDDFLQEREPYLGPQTDSVVPPLPATEYEEDGDDPKWGTEQEFRKGMVCHRCGCCIDRVYWNRWECPKCGLEHTATIRVYPLSEVAKENEKLRATKSRGQNRQNKTADGDWQQLYKDKAIEQVDRNIGGFDTTTYILPDANGNTIGAITHFKSNGAINAESGGPDQLWYDLQADDNLPKGEKKLDLKRNPVRHVGLPGEVRTRHYAENFGAPYKFVVTVVSKPFSDAPDAVLRAQARMEWASRAVAAEFDSILGDRERTDDCPKSEFEGFNELLLLGYMEKDAIGYHDDGEVELGPTVATLSLGSPSVFAVRPKAKAGISTEKSVTKDTAKMLEFAVLHGDIVVMHGSEIHRQYVHKVDPCGKRRYAATCRAILLEIIKDKEQRAIAKEYGTLPARAAEFAYHGHVDNSSDVKMED